LPDPDKQPPTLNLDVIIALTTILFLKARIKLLSIFAENPRNRKTTKMRERVTLKAARRSWLRNFLTPNSPIIMIKL